VYVRLRVACVARSVRRVCEAVSPIRYACPGLREKLCGYGVRVTSSGIPRRGLRTSRAHVLAWGTPRNARLAWDAQSDVVAARMVRIRQEGNPCRMLPSKRKGRETRTAAITSRERSAGCELPRWCTLKGKKKKRKASLATSGEQDPWAGGRRPPCSGHRRHELVGRVSDSSTGFMGTWVVPHGARGMD